MPLQPDLSSPPSLTVLDVYHMAALLEEAGFQNTPLSFTLLYPVHLNPQSAPHPNIFVALSALRVTFPVAL